MAKLRKGVSYRKLERPNTRVSKFKNKSFVRMTPTIKIVRFDMGDVRKDFEFSFHLVPKSSVQIRQEALESARQAAVRILEGNIGKTGFHFKIRKFPYHILRENPLAAGAGADRMSTGMQKSFGKPIGVACQVFSGDRLLTVSVDRQYVQVAKTALLKAAKKLPTSFLIETEQKQEQKFPAEAIALAE